MIQKIILLSVILMSAIITPIADAQEHKSKQTSDIIRLTEAEETWLNHHKTVKVSIPAVFPPLMFHEKNRFQGIIPDYLELFSKRTGLQFEMVSANLLDLPEQIRNRQTDMFPVNISLEPNTFMNLTDSCFSLNWVIVNRLDAPFFRNVTDLKGIKVSIVKDNPIYTQMITNYTNIEIYPESNPVDAMKFVSEGKTDAFVGSLPVVGYIIQKYRIANLKIAGDAGMEDFLFRFAVRIDYPELISILNKAIHSVTKQESDEIFHKWMIVRYQYAMDWHEIFQWTLLLSGIFIVILGISLLWNRRLATEISRRKQAEDSLRLAHDDLETRVQERTTDLVKTNQLLQSEIIERRHAEESLKENETRYRELTDSITDIFFAFDSELRYTYWNKASELLTKISAKEAIGKTLYDIFPDVKGTNIERFYLEAFRTQQPKHFEHSYQIKGEKIYFEISVYPSQKGISVFSKDISARKHAEEEQKFHSQILQNMAEGVFLIRSDNGLIVFSNPTFERMFGYDSGELIGKHVSIVNAPTEKSPEERAKEIIQRLNETGVWRGEVQNIRKDGVVFWCYANVSSFRHPRFGNIWVSIHEDITERKQSEEILRKYEVIIATISDPIAFMDRNYTYQIINEAYTKYQKKSRTDIIGHTTSELFGSKVFAQYVKPYFDRCIAGEIVRYQEWFDFPEQLPKYMDVGYYPVFDKNHAVVGIVVHSRDITNIKQIEKASQVSEEKYRKIFENANIGIFHSTPDGKFLKANPALSSMMGYESPDDLIRSITDIGAQIYVNSKKRNQILSSVLNKEDWIFAENQYRRKDGSIITCNLSVRKELKPDGSVDYLEGFVEDITAQKQAELNLRYERERFFSLLEQLPAYVYLLSPDHSLVYTNRLFRKYFGDPAGRRCYEIIHSYTSPCENCQTFNVFNTGNPQEWEWTHRHTGVIFQVYDYPFTDIDGSPLVIELGIDITKRKQLEDELKKAKEAAESANRAKSTFLANMSHEFRTPLNAVLGYAQILHKHPSSTEYQRDRLDIILKSGEHLLTLLNDILDLSKIEAGRMEPHPSEFHFPHFLESLVSMFEFRAKEKHIRFIYVPDPELPEFVRADEIRLRQILINLIGNAVKFTEKGSVVLKVKCEATTMKKDERQIIFEIEDTGPGIDPTEIETIFDPFEQASRHLGLSEGTGLGLSITQKLAELMSGKLTVQSTLGNGSIFRLDLELPVVKSDIQKLKPEIPPIIGYEGARKKILIVDDNTENRKMMADLLIPLGFDVTETNNGYDAVETAKIIQPDVILMDLFMPGMDGFETAREIRNQESLIPDFNCSISNSLILAVSAGTYDEHIQKSLDAGCNDFIPKPVHAGMLLEKIQKYTGLKWIFITPSFSQKEAAEDQLIIPPPLETVEILIKAANIGDIGEILEQTERLMKQEPFIPFASELKHLAKQFNMDMILEMLVKYMPPM